MEFRQLRYLVSIIDFGSVSKASGQLNIAQPALSRQISNLEAELKTQLLVRSARGVSPTEAGLRLYRQAQVILAQVEQAKLDAGMLEFNEQFVGAVAVGFPTSTAMMLALPYIRQMRNRFPGIQLRVVEGLSGHLLEMLLNNRLDIALQFRRDSVVGLHVEPLLDEQLFLVSADSETDGLAIELRELAKRTLSLPGKPHAMRAAVDQACQQAGVVLEIEFDADSLPTLRGVAASGLAETILPMSGLAEPSSYGPIYKRPIIRPDLHRPVSMCRSEGAPRSRAIEAAEEVLRFLVKELVLSGVWTGVTLEPALMQREPDKTMIRKRPVKPAR